MTVDPRRPRRVTVLGSFSTGGGDDTALAPDAARLVAYLAVHRRPQRRAVLAADLWPGVPGPAALVALDDAVAAAAGLVVPATPDPAGPAAVGTDPADPGLALADDVAVDLDAALRRVRALTGTASGGRPPADPADTAAATALLADDLLPGDPAPWLAVERERFRQLRLNALEELSGLLCAAGRHAEAVAPARAAVRAAPSRESARRALIEAHLAQGDIAGAVAQYDEYTELLRTSVGTGAGGAVGVFGGAAGPDGASGLDGLFPPAPAWPVLRVRRPLTGGMPPTGRRGARGPRRLVSGGAAPGTAR